MPSGLMSDRYKGFRYLVEIDGIPRAAFGYCVGLSEAHHPVEFFISDDEVDLADVADTEHNTHIVLAQGVAFDDAVYAWQRSASEGRTERHDGRIVELDLRGQVRHTYMIEGARPAYYQGVAVAGGSDRHIDTLEIECDNVTCQ